MTSASDTSGPEDSDGSDKPPCCKVQRTAFKFDSRELLSELSTKRKAGDSFREIAAYFNQEIVARALDDADIEQDRTLHAALTGDEIAEDVYDVLRRNSSSDIQRAEVRARLSDVGIDVSMLESAFVSHVTIRSHLQNCVEVTPDESLPPFDQVINTTQGARSRAVNVIQSTIDRGVKNGQIQTGDLEVDISVQMSCQDCGDTFYLAELLDQRRCSCTTSSSHESD